MVTYARGQYLATVNFKDIGNAKDYALKLDRLAKDEDEDDDEIDYKDEEMELAIRGPMKVSEGKDDE